MRIRSLILPALAIACLCAANGGAKAADLAVSPGPGVVDECGCYSYTVRHRVLLSTYGSHFDPNNYDETEPHYFMGRVKTFRRYSCQPPE